MPKEFAILGVSHHTTPLEVREQLAVPEKRLEAVLKDIAAQVAQTELMCLSTCNRVEFYAWTNDRAALVQNIRSILGNWADHSDLQPYIVERTGIAAVQHAFRVASSLDSMVVGEAQILGQFKDAFQFASNSGTMGPSLERILSRAVSVAKRVRTETAIGTGSVSISSVACDLAQKIFGSLHQKNVLLIGAGDMAEAAARQLSTEGANLSILNRSVERAESLARTLNAQAVSFAALDEKLLHADVAITSTGAEKPILTEPAVRQLVRARRGKPIFFIDIGVPRNIEASVGTLESVFLYNLDDLQLAAEHNARLRKQAADHADSIIESEIELFVQWQASLEISGTITAMRERALSLVTEELRKQKQRLQSGDDKDLEQVAQAIVGKLMHQPLTELKKATIEARGPLFVEFARRLFGIAHRTASQEAKVIEQTIKEKIG